MTHDSRFTIHDSTNEGLHLHLHRAGVDRVRARAVASRARAHRPPWSRPSDEAIVFASSPCTRAPGRWITGASGRTTRMNETTRPTGRRRRGRRDDRRRDDRVATDRATDVERWTDDDWLFFTNSRASSRARVRDSIARRAQIHQGWTRGDDAVRIGRGRETGLARAISGSSTGERGE